MGGGFVRSVFLFALGAAGYGALEIAFRGGTHWTMPLTGGLCVVLVCALARRLRGQDWQLCLMGGAVITALEIAVGLLVNFTLRWNVWDYGDVPFNLCGQICPMFSALWVLLTYPVIRLGRTVDAMMQKTGRRRGDGDGARTAKRR